MSHRTQITLTDDQYRRLRRESSRVGVGLAELIRRSVDSSYGATSHAALVDGLESSHGGWVDREEDGATYVEGRRHGLAHRLAAR